MENMKILHFFKTYYPDSYGGIEQVIYQLIETGREFGIEGEVLTLTPEKPGEIIVGDHKVHRVKRLLKLASTDISFGVLSKFKALAKEADLIHYHFPWPMADLAHFIVRHHKPCVLSYHSDIVAQKRLYKFYQPLMNRFLSTMGAIVVASPNYLQSSSVLKKYHAKVRCIPYGQKELKPPEPKRLEYWRDRFGQRFFLFVGVFRYYKGLTFLLEAARNLPCPIVLVGGGDLEAELKSKAAQNNLTNVHFTGMLSQEDKIALLSLCYGLIFPSHLRSEAFGLSLMEGAMFGKPLISCEIGTGTTFVNQEGQSGLVIPPADPLAIREAMLKLWNEPNLAARLGAGARERFLALFTAEKMVESFASLYKELLER
jgi:rhamnosyl/mannosyltransferase